MKNSFGKKKGIKKAINKRKNAPVWTKIKSKNSINRKYKVNWMKNRILRL